MVTQVEGGEESEGLAGGVDGVLGDGQVGGVAQDVIEGEGGVGDGGGKTFGP